MKIAYIILVHKNPKQVARLINRLNTQNTIFSLHLDASVPLEDFKNIVLSGNPGCDNIHFKEKRYRTRWGGFNAVRATAELIESVLPYKPDHVFFLSGQDYPLKTNQDIRTLLKEEYKDSILIENRRFNADPNKPNRLNRFYFCDYFDWEKKKLIPRLLTKVLPSRKFLDGMQPYIGRVQFILPLKAAEYVTAEYRNNKKLNNFFKYVLCADELYFQTILLNSEFAPKVLNTRIHYANYDVPHPVVWQAKDIEHLKKQPNLFARKFDINVDEKVLDLLDEYLQYSKPVDI
ncbi:beta-1,6-N-acetylglucosaminyltransferase [Pontibacter silvestris]|uniref:Peptide O-xylosyltransferase n=1 Tax=Pontibacter silvestris TaxID=2305183 RepID=A0ABW4WWS5_9BACT|nr:beta-1,6-N-acetylglucosaminyltransferase [Pontibacter silvestris]MCC9137332.1 beta-1,6-N-acetylglucosaminyltransferase [Pontibacter silvestris]